MISWGLVVFAGSLFVARKNVSSGLRFLAMCIGSLGDMTLAHFGVFENYPFVLGAGFFALAHIFYIFAYTSRTEKVFNKGFFIGMRIGISFIVLLLPVYFLSPHNDFLCLVLIYGFVIGFLLSVVFAYNYDKKSLVSKLNAVGIISFAVSDFLIGINIVGGIDFACRGDLVWLFYPIGQFLLII